MRRSGILTLDLIAWITDLSKLLNTHNYYSVGDNNIKNFNFLSTFNIGYEGHSKPKPISKMHPIYGGKGEYFLLLCLFAMVPFLKNARKNNEDTLRCEVKTNNRYAEMAIDTQWR